MSCWRGSGCWFELIAATDVTFSEFIHLSDRCNDSILVLRRQQSGLLGVCQENARRINGRPCKTISAIYFSHKESSDTAKSYDRTEKVPALSRAAQLSTKGSRARYVGR